VREILFYYILQSAYHAFGHSENAEGDRSFDIHAVYEIIRKSVTAAAELYFCIYNG